MHRIIDTAVGSIIATHIANHIGMNIPKEGREIPAMLFAARAAISACIAESSEAFISMFIPAMLLPETAMYTHAPIVNTIIHTRIHLELFSRLSHLSRKLFP